MSAVSRQLPVQASPTVLATSKFKSVRRWLRISLNLIGISTQTHRRVSLAVFLKSSWLCLMSRMEGNSSVRGSSTNSLKACNPCAPRPTHPKMTQSAGRSSAGSRFSKRLSARRGSVITRTRYPQIFELAAQDVLDFGFVFHKHDRIPFAFVLFTVFGLKLGKFLLA